MKNNLIITLTILILILPSAKSLAKDTVSYPYTGKYADPWVGILGGTGCSRHWDTLDAHDSSLSKPFDRCGQFNQVSRQHHKWVDITQFPANTPWFLVKPEVGDLILKKLHCDGERASEVIYALIQHEQCGDEGHVVTYCDESGLEVRPNQVDCTIAN